MADRDARTGGFTNHAVLLVLVLAGLLVADSRSAAGRAPAQKPHRGTDQAAEHGDSGADATSPAQIPARGWWQVLKRTFAGFNEDRVMTEAAGVTYYTLLAIFPAIAALVSIYGLFADPATVAKQIQSLQSVIPGGGMQIVEAQLQALTTKGSTGLGVGAVIGLLAAIWSANQGIKALFDALNVVYHEREKRSYLWRTLISLGFTLGLLAFAVLALTSIVVAPIVLNAFGLGGWGPRLIAAARWPVLIVLLSIVLSLIYRYGPSREHARWQWVSWGSAAASIVWLLASLAFTWYVANFGSYDKTYGSLGAVIGFMTWIWISNMIVLMGAELNAELEQQTDRDTTTGPEQPEGTRGAYKADVKA